MKRVIVGFAVAVLAVAGIARADSITITGGTVELNLPDGTTTAVMTGANTDISGFGTNPVTISFPAGAVGPLQPGPLTISTGAPGPTSAQLIDGTMYPATDHLQGTVTVTMSPFVAPTAPGSLAFFQTPFSMSGNVSVFNSSNTLLTTASLTGGGEASILTQTSSGGTSFNAQHVSFQFATGTASPTPEPATVVLLCVGMVGGVLGRRLIA